MIIVDIYIYQTYQLLDDRQPMHERKYEQFRTVDEKDVERWECRGALKEDFWNGIYEN